MLSNGHLDKGLKYDFQDIKNLIILEYLEII